MKKVIVALVILAVIITAGVLEHRHIDKTFNTLDEKLYAIENELHLKRDRKSVV